MMEVRTKFELPTGWLFRVLINDRFEEHLIHTNAANRIQHEQDQIYCGYIGYNEDDFVL